MKRVWCLYRVSTDKQLYKDAKGDADIPTQKRACHNFLIHTNKADWKIIREISANGVSGWKIETKDRDDLTEIKRGAENKEFDILLVFMFDRIGRREDETPFVVEFLVNHGIEVWSVEEGQQEIKTHTDKLMNYITFWNSSGESLKISERVKNANATINELGRYISGQAPYGYETYDTGIPHPKIKNKTLLGLRINPEEVELIIVVFDLYINKGLGGVRLSNYLNNKTSFKRRNNKPFTCEQINKIIRNPIYKGRKQYNKENKPKTEWKLQDYNPEWRIVSDDVWDKAQVLADQRRDSGKHKLEALTTHSDLLFSGLAFCSYCEAKLNVSHNHRKYITKSGEVHKQVVKRYSCQNARYEHYKDIHECTMFGGKTYDGKTISYIKLFLDQMSKKSEPIKIDNYINEDTKEKTKELNKLLRQKNEIMLEYKALEEEIPKALRGKSKFSEDRLSKLLDKEEKEIDLLNIKINEIEEKISNSKKEISEIIDTQKSLCNWGELFDKADNDTRKIMTSKIVEKVYFGKNKVKVKWNQNILAILKLFGGVFQDM